MEVISLDRRGKVWSAAHKAWVENVVFDVEKDSPEQILKKVIAEFKRRRKKSRRGKLTGWWASPECRTFSKMDAINGKWGQFRNWLKTTPWRPPLKPGSTVKGKLAWQADESMRRTLAVLEYIWSVKVKHQKMTEVEKEAEAQRLGCFLDLSELELAVENPQGTLEVQKYMKEWELRGCGGGRRVRRNDVDYCAYGHPYMKPTRIWSTGRHWTPKRCNQSCAGGKWFTGGKRRSWRHTYKLGQRSQQMVAGKGRVALAASVPRELLRTVLKA